MIQTLQCFFFCLTSVKCVIGGERCGKTALCTRFSKDTFVGEYIPTTTGRQIQTITELTGGTENYLRRENFGPDNVTVEILDCGAVMVGEEFESKLAKVPRLTLSFSLFLTTNFFPSGTNGPQASYWCTASLQKQVWRAFQSYSQILSKQDNSK